MNVFQPGFVPMKSKEWEKLDQKRQLASSSSQINEALQVVRFLKDNPLCRLYLPPLEDTKKWEWLTQNMGPLYPEALSKMESIVGSIRLCPLAEERLRYIGLSIVVKIAILLQDNPESENLLPPPGAQDWARIILDIEKHPWS